MRLVLEFKSGPYRLPKIWLTDGQRVTVGRSAEADHSCEQDAFMSSVHFRVEHRDNLWWVRDLGSTNGTYLNGEKTVEAALRQGDSLQAGRTVFSVVLDESAAVESSTVVPATAVVRQRVDLPENAGRPTPVAGKLSSVASPLAATVRLDLSSRASFSPPLSTVNATGAPPNTATSPGAAQNQTLRVASLSSRPIELLCVEVRSGGPPQKTWLPPGKSITVGRLGSADLCVPEDPTMSGAHFRLSCDYRECRIQDLNSRAGTLLNGRPVREAVIRHGDVILAGRTELIVEVRRERADQPHPIEEPSFVAQPCPSGAVLYQGTDPRLSWMEMVRLLSQVMPMYVIAHAPLHGDAVRTRSEFLLDWLSPAIARQLSPVVIPAGSVERVEPLLEGGWRQDAMACVFSHLDLRQLLKPLRLAVRGQSHPAETPLPAHMLGTCRPSHLARVLAAAAPRLAGAVFAGVEAILIEPQSSEHWEILGDESLRDVLELLGLSGAGPSLGR